MKRLVLTIHGVNTTGEWQDDVAEVLEPHFDCRAVRYEEYQRWGLFRALFGYWRKKRAQQKVHQQYDDLSYSRLLPPHLIAHSFGTVLGAELAKHPLVQFDRIIFAGSALPATTRWHALLKEDANKFAMLRNETGEKDLVVRLAGLARFLRPGLGNAGVIGFIGKGVHRLKGPRRRCEICDSKLARVHNAPLREYGHSTHFLGERHAAELWLPFLWGHDPEDYTAFLELCGKAALFAANDQRAELAEVEDELYQFRLRWLETRKERIELRECVLKHLECFLAAETTRPEPQKLEAYSRMVLRGIWKSVSRAVDEREKPPSQRDRQKVLALRPGFAVTRAVKELVERLGHG